MTLKLGDRVRIDIPDELDPDFNLHGEHAIVLDNNPGQCTCGCDVRYKVALETQDLSIERMSEAQSTPDQEERTACDLTAFQQTILTVLSEDSRYGLAIKSELEDYYGSEVNHGRLYPNLDELVERDLIAKSELDKRTNEYELTNEGYDLLLGELDWRFSKVVTGEERAEDITQLLDDTA